MLREEHPPLQLLLLFCNARKPYRGGNTCGIVIGFGYTGDTPRRVTSKKHTLHCGSAVTHCGGTPSPLMVCGMPTMPGNFAQVAHHVAPESEETGPNYWHKKKSRTTLRKQSRWNLPRRSRRQAHVFEGQNVQRRVPQWRMGW